MVPILVGKIVFLTDMSHGFTQFLSVNAMVVPSNGSLWALLLSVIL